MTTLEVVLVGALAVVVVVAGVAVYLLWGILSALGEIWKK